MADIASSSGFLAWLKDAGIVPERTRAVTISVGLTGPAMIYVDMMLPESAIKADARALFGGAQIIDPNRPEIDY